jgi:hypothetical protein
MTATDPNDQMGARSMINRREIMASGLAVTLLARTSAAAIPTTATGSGRFIFVADESLAEARAAARSARALGAATRFMATDVTPVYLWLDETLRKAPAAVAGLSTWHAPFLLERLGWDRGLRTIYRGIHRRTGGSSPAHELSGSPAIVERIRGIVAGDGIGGRHWAASLGRALAATSPGDVDDRHVLGAQRPPGLDDAALVSWLLVPRSMLLSRRRAATDKA